ncbi:SH3 domain-containing protein 19 isoform X1 [Seriola lalandi dorsalis]|uniref:SH3 domain-containing protein 19 isoform X1 n=1 Tax=Seriola lalandi dorsalis TaxID=1841481 RepID=UPI000C6FCBB3|nr:SH3 domain-containing protein 19 isoform X1 [Seriola lalandi dorsalis]
MAEARREDEDEGERRDLRELRELRCRGQATDHPERTKPELLPSSQGPLSSIRAAIKRTRANSQCEHTRDRRRPEITIISAEPLASNNWFPGASVVFTPPPPQSGWSAGIQAVSQPPPSYDQVIQEKTQEEHIVKPTAAPRRPTCTTTCATQTDPVRDNTATTLPQSAEKRPAGKTPQKPPRPSLPKPVDIEPLTETVTPSDGKVGTNTTASTNTENQSGSKSDVKQHNQEDPTHTCARSVTVYWDIPANPVSAPAEATPSSSNSEPSQRPVPLPRTKSRKQATPEKVNDKSLVELSENCDSVHSDAEEASSNKYLKELLEVFSAENQFEENSDIVNQSDEASQGEDAVGEMNSNSSQRNIRARIQAFESQADTEEGSVAESAKPEPRPRKAAIKPPVAAKPSVSLKPQFDHSADDYYQNVSSINVTQNHTPAPRPQPPKKMAALSIKEELETLHSKAAIPNRSRPSVLTRANSIYEEEPSPLPPVPPVKPFKEPLKPNLNINNHNSASIISGNECVNSLSDHIPVKPQRNVDSNGASFSRQSVSRRPTTIRVPSKSGSFSDHFQDSPPPLPVQKPVGSLNTPVYHKQNSTPILPSQESFQVGPEPSLPPRRHSTTKILPPRPPPAKTGPGRPPPPSLKATGRSVSAPWDTSPRPQAQKPHRKGPVLPPRPNPGHRLYNKYTLELPHGIAAFDYNGSNTGELSFQKNEVLLLLEEIDRDTFECQIGDTRGRVHKSRMKVITPLASDMYPPQGAGQSATGRDGYGKKVQVIHDFIPEGPGELGLRAGDVVTMVEQVDNEWYRGTCRGSTGFFPMNYVKVLSDSPRTLPGRKPKPPSATASGPRCVARFDFEGEHSDELSFCEGDVIQLKEYIGQEWARGQIAVSTGIFPLNFVEVIEDLPPPPSQQQTQTQTQTQPSRIALPGMVASPNVSAEVSKPTQASQSKVDWAVALYDYAGKSEDDLSFQQGDCILITRHINAEWSCGRLNGKEGMFPRAFIESNTAAPQSDNSQQNEAAGGGRARALYNFTSDCDEELSLQIGDIITKLESIDEEWFLGDLRGKRALVPKNYVQVLG